MLILDNNNEPIILNSIHTPTTIDHYWVLNLDIMDFTINPLLVLEEITAPTIELELLNFRFVLPANWNLLVVDIDTYQLDVVEISKLAGQEFHAFMYGPNESRVSMEVVRVCDYNPHFVNIGPSISKNQMLCHPVSPELWINVSPFDPYNKYLKNKVIGDLT